MEKFSKIIICIIVILVAIVVGYLIYNGQENETSGNTLTNNNTVNTNTSDTNNDVVENQNNNNNETQENTDYIGKEENKEEPQEELQDEKTETESSTKNEPQELTGKDKAVDIVEKEYALDGQTVRFDHMEGENYIIKINDGTAVTWYLVDGTTWEAEEY